MRGMLEVQLAVTLKKKSEDVDIGTADFLNIGPFDRYRFVPHGHLIQSFLPALLSTLRTTRRIQTIGHSAVQQAYVAALTSSCTPRMLFVLAHKP